MNQTRVVILALLAVAATGMVVGTSGDTAFLMAGDTSAEVVDDSYAYIAYQSSDLTARNGETVDLVTVTNRRSDGIEVTDVTIVDGDAVVRNPTSPNTIGPGERGTIQATVDCSPPQTHKIAVTISVTANGDAFGAHLSGDTPARSFNLECVPSQNPETEGEGETETETETETEGEGETETETETETKGEGKTEN